MQYTGERYIPEHGCYTIIAEEHWHRYFFASKYVSNKTVLDFACGEGYGSHLLSKYAHQTYGRDISVEAIAWARSKYDNIDFDVMDIAKIDLPADFFDVITCFETIEHIDENAQKQALASFSKILKKDGILLISTPNIMTDLYAKDNHFHRHELSYADFKAILEQNFAYVKIVGQSVYCCSIIGDCSEDKTEILNKIDFSGQNCTPHLENDRYFIAICSNSPIESNSCFDSILIDRSLSAFKQLIHVRNCVNKLLPLYNALLKIIYHITPIKSWRQKIKSYMW